jgi:hypothetical protein
MLEAAIAENMGIIIVGIGILLLVLIVFKIYKFRRIVDLDRSFKKWGENGKPCQDGNPRNIWDYHFFPGISRLWHSSEWQDAIVLSILVGLFVIYLFTKDTLVSHLLTVNFGAIIGMFVKRYEVKKQ